MGPLQNFPPLQQPLASFFVLFFPAPTPCLLHCHFTFVLPSVPPLQSPSFVSASDTFPVPRPLSLLCSVTLPCPEYMQPCMELWIGLYPSDSRFIPLSGKIVSPFLVLRFPGFLPWLSCCFVSWVLCVRHAGLTCPDQAVIFPCGLIVLLILCIRPCCPSVLFSLRYFLFP